MDVWNAAVFYSIAIALTAWVVVLHRRDRKYIIPATLAATAMAVAAGFVLVGTHATTPSGLFFYFFAIAGIAAGYLMITARHPVHGSLWLLVAILCIAGIMILLHAQFLGTAYVLLFAGAVLVFYLSSVTMVEWQDKPAPDLWISRYTVASLAGFAAFVLICAFLADMPADTENEIGANALTGALHLSGASTIEAPDGETAELGNVLLGQYLLVFLAVALLLATAIVGGVYLAHYEAPADTRYR